MKDEELFLETEFTLNNLISIRTKLIENGWVIESVNNTVIIYESLDDKNCDEQMCEYTTSSYEESLLNCFNKIKEYYIRIKL
jgi:hypothetical protein